MAKRGQLIQRGENVWLVRVFKGRDNNGKRAYVNRTVHGSKRTAQQALTELLSAKDRDELARPSRETVETLLARWLDSVARTTVRPRTFQDYDSIAKRYVIPGLGRTLLSKLRTEQIDALYRDLEAKGLSARTVRYTHSVLHNALEHARRKWKWIASNPAKEATPPSLLRREKTVLDERDASRFLEAAANDRWWPLWNLLLSAGLRPGEALGLKWDDLDGNRIRIRRALVRPARSGWSLEEPKTPHSRRSVALPGSTVEVLRQHRVRQAAEKLSKGPAYADHNLMFATTAGEPLDWRVVSRRHFKRIAKAAGLSDRLRPYDLRHSCATLLLRSGENAKVVSERLGHKNVSLTLDVYSDVLPDMQQQSADKLESLLFGT